MKIRKMFLLLSLFLLLTLPACKSNMGIGSSKLFDTYYGLTRLEVKKIAPKYEPMGENWVMIDKKMVSN